VALVFGPLWRDRPDDELELTLAPDASGQGTAMRFVLTGPASADDREQHRLRHRLNQLLSGRLRNYLDTGDPSD